MCKYNHSLIIATFVTLAITSSLYSLIPLTNTPSWTSNDNDYSTGGGFADLNNDGFLDFCTSNGNDMAMNKQAIYYNNNGILEMQASWRSLDSGMFGHLYLGDVNNDGHFDMAVAYLGPQGDCKTRIYYNTGNGLSTLPTWISQDTDSSFDCAFGDVDLDGDLDLAVTAGDAYTNRKSPAKIYRNNNGIFESLPYWTSSDSTPSDAIRFADLNNDGYLDLIVGYRRKLAIFYNHNGILETTASFSITITTWILRIATADYNKDGWLDIAIAGNGQLSGDSSYIKVFTNNQGQINQQATYTLKRNTQYNSCIAWIDFNNDKYLDLAGGGWWETLVVYENHNGQLDTVPAWTYSNVSLLVAEALIGGAVRNNYQSIQTDTFINNNFRKLFYLSKSPIHKIISIIKNNDSIAVMDYCYDPLTSWFVIANPPQTNETIICSYLYSPYPDLAVTNWTRTAGNYLFFNTTQFAITEIPAKPESEYFTTSENPFISQIQFNITIDNAIVEIYNASGMFIKQLSVAPYIWFGENEYNQKVAKGIYFVKIKQADRIFTKKIIKLK